MAVHKKKATLKTNKKVVKKHKAHKVASPEIQQDVSKQEQTPVSENTASPTVISSGVLPDTSKEMPLPEAVTPQPLQQNPDVLTPQPSSAMSTPSTETGVVTQNPLAVEDAEKDKAEEHIEEPKKKGSWIVIVLIIVGIVLIGGALWYFRENAVKQVSLEDKITSTPSPSKISPTPASDSAKLIVDYSKYKIQVLNGSGIAGAAAKGKEILEAEKFIVEEIGNAEASDYDLTVIQAKKGVPSAFLDKLESVLGETYLLGSSEVLEASEELDVVIIIGSSKAE